MGSSETGADAGLLEAGAKPASVPETGADAELLEVGAEPTSASETGADAELLEAGAEAGTSVGGKPGTEEAVDWNPSAVATSARVADSRASR
jgi:hypothetical protein